MPTNSLCRTPLLQALHIKEFWNTIDDFLEAELPTCLRKAGPPSTPWRTKVKGRVDDFRRGGQRGNRTITMKMHRSEMTTPLKALAAHGKLVIESPIGICDREAFEDEETEQPSFSSQSCRPQSARHNENSSCADTPHSPAKAQEESASKASRSRSFQTSCSSTEHGSSHKTAARTCSGVEASTHSTSAQQEGEHSEKERQEPGVGIPANQQPLRQRVAVSSFSMGVGTTNSSVRAGPTMSAASQGPNATKEKKTKDANQSVTTNKGTMKQGITQNKGAANKGTTNNKGQEAQKMRTE